MRTVKGVFACVSFLLIVSSVNGSPAFAGEFRILGQPFANARNIWDLTPGLGLNWKLYGGTDFGVGGPGHWFYWQPPEPGYFVDLGYVAAEWGIYSLTTGIPWDAKIYGGTGFGCRFFYYNPVTGQTTDKGKVYWPDPTEQLVYDLTTGIDGRIFGGTGGTDIRIDNGGDLFQYNPITDQVTWLGEPVPGEDIISSLTTVRAGPWQGLILCGTGHHNWLFVYDPFDSTHSIWLGPVVEGETYVLGLTTYPTGDVMYGGTHPSGYLFRVSYEIGVEVLGMAMGYPVGIRALTCGLNGKVYGGLYNGHVFEYDPGLPWNPGGSINPNPRDLGKPVDSYDRIRSLTTGPDGYIYGGASRLEMNQRPAVLFLYDPYVAKSGSQVANQLSQSGPFESALFESWPNPLTQMTDVRYQTPEPGHVTLEIYDVSGTLVSTLVDQEQTSGCHSVRWEGKDSKGSDVPSGTYLCRLYRTGQVIQTIKLVVLR